MRGYEYEYRKSEEALERLCASPEATVEQILGLSAIYRATGRIVKAEALFTETHEVFEKNDAIQNWVSWMAQVQIALGHHREAMKLIEDYELDEELESIYALAIRQRAIESGDWAEAKTLLADALLRSDDFFVLYEACVAAMHEEDWEFVCSRKELLLEKARTFEMFRMCAVALHNSGAREDCLSLIEEARTLFEESRCYNAFEPLRISCLVALGYLSDAITHARDFARENPTPENYFDLLGLYVLSGDFPGMSLATKMLLPMETSAARLLYVCKIILPVNKNIASSVWDRTVEIGVEDKDVSLAVQLGYNLKKEDALQALLVRFSTLGALSAHGVEAKTLKDLIDFVGKRREDLQRAYDLYRKGEITVDIYCNVLGDPLVRIFHEVLIDNALQEPHLRSFPIYAIHGGRGDEFNITSGADELSVFADMTAILLGAEMGVLSFLEGLENPIYIPEELIPSLLEMKANLEHPQPERIEVYQEIARLLEEQKIQIAPRNLPALRKDLLAELDERWVGLYEFACSEGGILVDFLPLKRGLTNEEISVLQGSDLESLTDVRSVVQSLRNGGPLSESEFQAAMMSLGTMSRVEPSARVPEQRSTLVFHGNTPEVLATAGLLTTVCARFHVTIEDTEAARVRQALEHIRKSKQTIEWLEELIERMNRGLDDGTYAIIPENFIHAEDEARDKESVNGGDLYTKGLLKLAQLKPREHSVVWCDDRYFNGHGFVKSIPIVTSYDLLRYARRKSLLDDSSYFRALHKFRQSEVRYVPLDAEEPLFQLRQAINENAEIVDTDELKSLRRYFARCLRDCQDIQRPAKEGESQHKIGEIGVMTKYHSTSCLALTKIWNCSDLSPVERIRMSNWLIDNLHLDLLGIAEVTRFTETNEKAGYMQAISIFSLINIAWTLCAKSYDEETNRMSEYIEWLTERLFRWNIHVYPPILESVADLFLEQVESLRLDVEDEESDFFTYLLRQIYDSFPKELRSSLLARSSFKSLLGFTERSLSSYAGGEFDHEEFLRSIGTVLNGRPAKLLSHDGTEYSLVAARKGEDDCAFQVVRGNSSKSVVNSEWKFSLLHDSPIKREACLREHEAEFDTTTEEFQSIIEGILSKQSGQERMDLTIQCISHTATAQYSELQDDMEKTQEADFVRLISVEPRHIFAHLRLPQSLDNEITTQDYVSRASDELTAALGIEAAFTRLSGIPVPIPIPLLQRFSALDEDDLREVLRKLMREPASPLSRIHFLRLLVSLSADNEVCLRLSRSLVRRFMTVESITEFKSYLVCLDCIHEEYMTRESFTDLPYRERLLFIWMHADKVFRAFRNLGLKSDWIGEYFQNRTRRAPSEILLYENEYHLESIHPNNVNILSFLIFGLDYSIEGNLDYKFLDELRQAAIDIAFPSLDGPRQRPWRLYQSRVSRRNCTDSFLGNREGVSLIPVFDADIASLLSADTLRELFEYCVSTLERDPSDTESWRILSTLSNSHGGDVSHFERLNGVIANTSFLDQYEKAHDSGLAGLWFACQWSRRGDDDGLLSHVESELFQAIQIFDEWKMTSEAKGNSGEDDQGRSGALLDMVLNLAIGQNGCANTPENFAKLVYEILQINPSLASTFEGVIAMLYQTLPPDQCRYFAKPMVFVRATL